jgi:hypothetical protein
MKISALLFCVLTGIGLLTGFVLFTSNSSDYWTDSPVNWENKLEIDSGDAYQGPWRMNQSEFLYVDDPTVAINEDGVTGIAWADQARQEIMFQAIGPDGEMQHAEPVNASRHPGIFSWLPRMVMTSDKVFLLWQEIVFSGGSHGGEIFFSRSTDAGATFSEAMNLSNTEAGAGKGRLSLHRWDNGSLDLAMGPEGNLYAVWTEYEGPLFISRSTDEGESFSEPVRIAGSDSSPARGPSLAVDSEGNVHIAWTVGEDDRADIRYAKSADQGESFSEPQVVRETAGHSDAPKIAVDSENTVHLVYAESNPDFSQRYNVYYTRLEGDKDQFDEPRQISTDHSGQVQSMSFPEITVDENNSLYVIWELYPNVHLRPEGLAFTYSKNGGATFASPSLVSGTAGPELGTIGSRQGSLMRRLAVGDAGSLAIVNSTFLRGESSHIWLIRGEVISRHE